MVSCICIIHAMSIPSRPDPPVVGKVTHNSIELYWHTEEREASPRSGSPTKGDHRLRYTIQEEEVGSRSKGFGNVYSGYSTSNVFEGLEPRTQYRYRLQCINDNGASAWSSAVVVMTTIKPKTSEDLQKAVMKGDVDMVKKILPELSWQAANSPDKFGLSPLMVAAQKGYLDMAKTLLHYGADVHYQNSSGKTPLMMACFSGQLEVLKLLREKGASWEPRDKTGSTALHWAVDGANLDVVRWMLQDGCPVNVKDETSGWTPLLRCAAVNGNLNIARVLIHNGANVNNMDRDGKTVLMNSALNGFEPLVKFLVSKGASVATKSEHGKTALDFAKSFDHERVIHFLHEQMEDYKKAQNEKKLKDARKERKETLDKTKMSLSSNQDVGHLSVPHAVSSKENIEQLAQKRSSTTPEGLKI